MSENYEPKINEVRQSYSFKMVKPIWYKTENGNVDALLVEGVPMIGDACVDGHGKEFTVASYSVYIVGEQAGGMVGCLRPVEQLRPAPSQEDREVEAMMEALQTERGYKMSDRNIVIAIREALDRVRGGA